MTVLVSLNLAVICFMGQCHPALVGASTPPGEYRLRQRLVASPGYGGDVLVFREDPTELFAILRVWTGVPAALRVQRLRADSASARQGVTQGCINIAPDVYDR